MFWKLDLLGLHGQPEVKFFLVFFVFKANLLLKLNQMNDCFVFAGKVTDSGHDSQGISKVNAKDSVEEADYKTELDVICKPEEPFQDFWVNQKVVDGTQKPPVEGKLRTDNSFDVAPVFGIIPEADFHADNKNHSGNEFKKGDAESHKAK